jgi:phage repressor protein C with HTH and peptisase S24 domain
VEPDRGADWVKSNQNLEESDAEEIVKTAQEGSGIIEKKGEITTNDLEESDAEEIVKTVQEGSGIIEKKEETTNDLDESVVEETGDAKESSDEEEENGASSEEELVADPDSDSEVQRCLRQPQRMTRSSGSNVTRQRALITSGATRS